MRKIDDSVYIADGAQVVDEVVIGKGSSVWYNAVLRGDDNQIIIGERSNIQDNCVVHVGTDNPTIIGDDVSVGHLALLHGCTIGNGTLIGMGSIVMNGAKIGCRCIVGAGSLVTKDTVIPDDSLAFGRPARVIRKLSAEDTKENVKDARFYHEMAAQKMKKRDTASK